MVDKRYKYQTEYGDYLLDQIRIVQLSNGWTVRLEYTGKQSEYHKEDAFYCETLVDVINYIVNTFNIKFKVVPDDGTN